MKQNKAREEIVKLFIDCLEKEDLPWHQGFIPSRTSFNPVTNTTYKNSNRFILYINEYIHHYDDPRWMTFNQASKNGYHIRKGEKGVPIEYWSIYDSKEKKKLSHFEAHQLLTEHPERKDDIRYISQVYTVFNAKQIDGIEPYKEIKAVEKDDIDEQFSVPYQLLYEFAHETDLDIKEDIKANTPFYRPSEDKVVIPEHHRYRTADAFFSDAFHEVSHSTAHSKRLNRTIASYDEDRESYAIEELRAEIGSSFICNDLGIVPQKNDDYLENSQAYIQNWLKAIREKPNTLFQAIKDAEKICNYVLEKGHYVQFKRIDESLRDIAVDGKYTENAINQDDLRLLLRHGFVELDADEMKKAVNDWCEGKEVKREIYYSFDDGKIVCADNTSNDMFMEEFSKDDLALAFLWMAKGMDISEINSLKYHEGTDLTAEK